MPIYLEIGNFVTVYTDGGINKTHLNRYKQGLFVQSLLHQGSRPKTIGFGSDSKARRGVGKLYSGKERSHHRLWLNSDWKSLAWGS